MTVPEIRERLDDLQRRAVRLLVEHAEYTRNAHHWAALAEEKRRAAVATAREAASLQRLLDDEITRAANVDWPDTEEPVDDSAREELARRAWEESENDALAEVTA